MDSYDRDGHAALDNRAATYCRRCGRASAFWPHCRCDNQPCEVNEYDECGALTRIAT